MSTLAIARLDDVRLGPDIVAYLERIDATLVPFGGRFLVHGGPYERIEGAWTGDVVIIEFASRELARAWYGSPAYAEILPLRVRNATSHVIMIDTVAHDYKATDVLEGLPGA